MSDSSARPPVAPPPKLKKRNVTPAKWAQIEEAWIQGKFATLSDLSEHFKVPVNSLKIRFSDRKLRRGQAIEEYHKKIEEELAKKAAEQAKVLSARVEETREQHYQMATGITKLTYAEILKAKQDGLPLSAIKGNLSSLESAMKILKMAREERFAVLGLNEKETDDDDEGLPELVISELTPEDIETLRSRNVESEEEGDDEPIIDLAGELPDNLADPGADDLIEEE